MFSNAVVQTKVINCNSAKKSCLLQVVHTKAIAALTQFRDFFFLAGNGNEFNCPSQCGLYAPEDIKGPKFHEKCTSMEEGPVCKKEFKIKGRKKKKKKSNQRIVGGKESKYPMPWMVSSKISILLS